MSNHISYENGRLVVTRTFDAPRQIVFDAWIETSKVKLWWGCDDALQVQSKIEPRVGGEYLHTMTLKDVGEYRHHGIITKYEPPKRFAYRLHDAFHEKPMMVEVEFMEENDTRTRVRLTQDNLPETYSEFIIAGWSESFEKLHAYLKKTETMKGIAK